MRLDLETKKQIEAKVNEDPFGVGSQVLLLAILAELTNLSTEVWKLKQATERK